MFRHWQWYHSYRLPYMLGKWLAFFGIAKDNIRSTHYYDVQLTREYDSYPIPDNPTRCYHMYRYKFTSIYKNSWFVYETAIPIEYKTVRIEFHPIDR